MKKSFQIVSVRPILNIDRPIVVFEVAGNEPIVRNPKQALTDLQNSGRALEIDATAFSGGYNAVPQMIKAQFIQALFDCAGATITGDITNIKAGDEYTVTAGHPALTDTNHPHYNKVKEGGKLKAEKDGVWVEGFLSIPLTPAELLRRDMSTKMAQTMMQLMGLAGSAPVAAAPIANDAFDTDPVGIPAGTAAEAFGGKK